MEDTLTKIMKTYEETKKAGKFFFDYNIKPSERMKVLLALKNENVFVIDKDQATIQVSWVGCKQWYKTTTGKSSYNRDLVMQQAIPQIITDTKVSKKVLRFLNPVYNMDLIEEESDGKKMWTCKNIMTSINKLFPVINKYK